MTELDVISPTGSHRPPSSTTGAREGGGRTLHLQQVLTEHVTALSAEMGGGGVRDVGPVLYPGLHFAVSVAGPDCGAGDLQGPTPADYLTLAGVQGTDPSLSLPSLRAWWEDVLPRGGVASGLSLLWTPALHPVHLSGRPPGLPAGDLPL